MNFTFFISRIYFHTNIFVIFAFTQILINIGLLIYLLSDFTAHFQEPFVIVSESVIAILMLIDVLTYSIIQGIKFDLLTFLEWATLINFAISFIIIIANGVQKQSEEFEIILMIARFILQIVRLPIGLFRLSEHQVKKNVTNDIDCGAKEEGDEEPVVRFRAVEMMDIWKENYFKLVIFF